MFNVAVVITSKTAADELTGGGGGGGGGAGELPFAFGIDLVALTTGIGQRDACEQGEHQGDQDRI